jgi:hypothetical protein
MFIAMLFSNLNVLYLYTSTFRSMCAVPNRSVFCTSLISCFRCRYMLLRFFPNCFEMVPVTPLITGGAFVFTLDVRCRSTVEVFIVQNLGVFLDYISLLEIAAPINIRVTLSLTDFYVRFIVRNGCVSLSLLIPKYDYFTFMN